MVKDFRRLSAPGAAALSCWRLTAPAEALREVLGTIPGSLPRVVRVGPRAEPLDEGVCFTSHDGAGVELHLHGGTGVARALRSWLLAAGWREEPALEWSGQVPAWPTADAAYAAFLQAESPRAAAAWSVFAAQDAPAVAAEGRSLAAAERARWAAERLRHAAWAVELERPRVVALAGPANAGKSSLFNAWLGRARATVADAPGTTRDVLGASVSLGVGAAARSMRLLDTAGLWDDATGVDALAVARSARALAEADRVLWVFDAATPPGPRAQAAVAQARAGDVFLLHRTDLGRRWEPRRLRPGPGLEGSRQVEGPELLTRLEASLAANLGPDPGLGAWLPLGAGLRAHLREIAQDGPLRG